MQQDQAQLMDQAQYANEAFYLAFEAKDANAMSHLWSETANIVCLHPGWPALVGRQAVMESWTSILSNPQQGQVSFYNASCHQLGEESVLVVCYERAGNAVMVASNTFRLESGRLRMVVHHAGFCGQPPKLPS